MGTSLINYHAGTDLQLGSWLFLVSSILFLIISCRYVYVGYNDYDDDFTQVNFLILLISSILFVIASGLFVYASYPQEMMKLMTRIQSQEASRLTFIEKYFIGNYFTIALWLLTISLLPVFVYIIWAYIDGIIEIAVFIFFLVVMVAVYAALALWIIASFPESLESNNGMGSTYFFNLFCCFDYFFDNKVFLKKHLTPDFLAASWIFVVFVMAGVVVSAYLLYANYLSPDLWIYVLFLCSIVILSIGSLLFVYGVYPYNIAGSNLFWQVLICEPKLEPSDMEIENMRRECLPLL